MKGSPSPCKCHLRRLLFFATACLLLTHCRTVSFYTQAARGQWQILHRAEPIEKVINRPETSPELRKQLNTVQELRHYAATQLGLPTARQYDRYADLQRGHVVWVLFVCPELSTEPHLWKYPLLGKLAYTGYFSPEKAEREAERFRERGDDVHVAEVDAYSTLGFFSDPVLNTFVGKPTTQLAELIFHELTHQRLYLKGDTDFNEALATAVGQAATERWLASRGEQTLLKKYQQEQQILTDFVDLLLQCRDRLSFIYGDETLSDQDKRTRKASEWTRLRREADELNHRYGGSLKIDKWFAQPLNNARLTSISSYFLWVPAFRHLLDKVDGNLDRFFQQVSAQESKTPAQRLTWLRSLGAQTTTDRSVQRK